MGCIPCATKDEVTFLGWTEKKREKVQWLFLTLTVKNEPSEKITEAISGMFKGFQR